jgi:photosystem II stability/assembly factor-like uncharacterized protein
MANAARRLIVGTRKGLFLLARAARGGWKIDGYLLAAAPVPYAFRDERDGVLWASQDHGHWGAKLKRSRDEGRTWEDVAPPKYPKTARIKPWTLGGKKIPATLAYIWVIAPGGADQPERIYLGTEPGGLFRSDDGGATFHLVTGLWNHPSRLEKWFGGGRDNAGIHSVLVDPRDSRRVLVGVSCAGVFETTDDGKTWAPRNQGLHADFLPDPKAEVGHDPHFVDASPAHPDSLWMQNHCGIYRSTNGAKSWQRVSREGNAAHFGFAVAVDGEDPRTAWVVPAISDTHRTAVRGALCVCRTTDGGKTWRELRQGLPQKHAFDVTFRHALDNAGDTVAFGTTSGNLYVSEDRGQSWTCLANNLPPIYSVRFAA